MEDYSLIEKNLFVDLKKEITIPKRLMLLPYQTNCSKRVREALQLPPVDFFGPVFSKYIAEIIAGLKYIFQTKNPLTFALSCSGLGVTEAIITNFLRPEEKIVVASGKSYWYEKACIIARRCGSEAFLVKEDKCTVSLEEVEAALSRYKPRLFLVVHGDTSTGMLQNLEGIGDLCIKYDCLFVVDCVATICAVPVFVDKWKIDIAFATSNKGIGSYPGLSPITLSERAKKVLYAKDRSDPPTYYFDFKGLIDFWIPANGSRIYHHTLSTPVMLALREALSLIIEESLPVIFARHGKCQKYFYEALQEIPYLKHAIPDATMRIPFITYLNITSEFDGTTEDFLKLCQEKYNIEVGINHYNPCEIRVSFLGPNANIANVDTFIKAAKNIFSERSKIA